MGSNSLLEGLALGARTGRAIAAAGHASAGHAAPEFTGQSEANLGGPAGHSVTLNLQDITYSMKSLMWRHMGVERTGDGLVEAQEKLSFWAKVVRELAPKEGRTVELLNMLTFAHLSTSSALSREESRGVHHRDDYPESDESCRYHSLLRARSEGDQVIGAEPTREPVGPASVPST